MDNFFNFSNLCLDDQFMLLLHKKIMDKKGSARRQAKKYYTDRYKKTGIIAAGDIPDYSFVIIRVIMRFYPRTFIGVIIAGNGGEAVFQCDGCLSTVESAFSIDNWLRHAIVV